MRAWWRRYVKRVEDGDWEPEIYFFIVVPILLFLLFLWLSGCLK